jgi:hypothetical protein
MKLPDGFLDAYSETIEGLPQVRWLAASKWVEHNAPDNPNDAWQAIVREWLTRLSARLGPGYHISSHGQFVLLCGKRATQSDRLAELSDSSFNRIAALFPALPEPPVLGPRLVLVFDDPERYYSYLSAHYPDGSFPSTSGCQLREGYRHIAINSAHGDVHATLLHELVHLRLTDFATPLWLEEGLAEYLPQFLVGRHTFLIDQEMVRRHKAFWSATTLEPFWAGESFGMIDEGGELSYHLAELLLRNLIADHPRAVRPFVQQASWEDAGAAAAHACFGRTLGQIAGQFLGPGDWEPQGGASASDL